MNAGDIAQIIYASGGLLLAIWWRLNDKTGVK